MVTERPLMSVQLVPRHCAFAPDGIALALTEKVPLVLVFDVRLNGGAATVPVVRQVYRLVFDHAWSCPAATSTTRAVFDARLGIVKVRPPLAMVVQLPSVVALAPCLYR